MPRAAKLQISFADWELLQQGISLEPLLESISVFLDDHEPMIEAVRADLQRGLKNPGTGRSGLTPQQVLRSLILMRVKNWNYRELRERISDGYTLRQFTDFYCQPVPKHDAFNRAFNRLTPETLQAVNALVVQAAVDLGLEDGQKLRVDTTVVQTDIHHPTDNTLLWDVVRVVTRLVRLLAAGLLSGVQGFHNRTRAARRRMQEIQRMTIRQRHTQQTGKYRQLIHITEEVVQSARKVLKQTRKARGKDLLADQKNDELRKEIDYYCGLGDRVIDQARRRVLEGEQVPASEKIYSIFEPHTDLIKRGKVQTPVEFGHKVFLAESAQGLITQYEVLRGNPGDEQHVEPSLGRHKETFGHAPELYGSDRGFFSENNVESCHKGGVKVVCIPQRGGKKTAEREAYEKSPDFKKGQRFRAGIEGRISVLFRGRGMKRCLAQGHQHFELYVGAAVLANNLMRIAALLTQPSSRKRRTAAWHFLSPPTAQSASWSSGHTSSIPCRNPRPQWSALSKQSLR
jgi:IS5 family transposase